MRYILDTTLLIDHADGVPPAVALVASLFETPNDLFTCDAIVAEALSRGTRSAPDIQPVVVPSNDATWKTGWPSGVGAIARARRWSRVSRGKVASGIPVPLSGVSAGSA